MSPKQPSKQKRAAQNRNQRAARAARTANAQMPAAERSAGTARPASSGGSLLSRLRGGGTPGAGAARSGGRAVPAMPPGYRAALSAVLAAAAAALLCTFALRYPVDAQGDLYASETLAADWSASALRAVADNPDADAAEVAAAVDDWTPGRGKDTVVKALWPYSLAIALPLIAAGLGFHAVRRRSSSKVVSRTLYATLFGAVLTQGLLLLFLPVVLAMGVAMFQVRKAEAVAAASAPDAGVIEVDEVEAEADVIEADVIEADVIDDAQVVTDATDAEDESAP